MANSYFLMQIHFLINQICVIQFSYLWPYAYNVITLLAFLIKMMLSMVPDALSTPLISDTK